MKIQVLLFLLICLLAGSSCNLLTGENGNGHVVKQNRQLSPFSKIKIDGVFNVILKQGDVPEVIVETDENLQGLVQTVVEGDLLLLQQKPHTSIGNSTKMNVYVTVNILSELGIGGVGNVSCANTLTQDQLILFTSGVGSTKLNLNCNSLAAKMKGVGNVSLAGMANMATIHNEGVGNLKAYDFIVQDLRITNEGVGNAQVDAERTISITNTGVGNVQHKGNATVTLSNDKGVGEVEKR